MATVDQSEAAERSESSGPAYLRALSSGLRGAALPYGFAVVFWGSGQVVSSLRSPPNVGQVVLFVGGAVLAYGVLKLITGERESEVAPQIGSPHVLRAGAIHVVAMGIAIGSAALVGLIDSGVAWPLAGFLATLLYIVTTSLELSLLEVESSQIGG